MQHSRESKVTKVAVRDSTVKEVGSHEELEGNLGGNGELRDLGGAVGVAHLQVLYHYQ